MVSSTVDFSVKVDIVLVSEITTTATTDDATNSLSEDYDFNVIYCIIPFKEI